MAKRDEGDAGARAHAAALPADRALILYDRIRLGLLALFLLLLVLAMTFPLMNITNVGFTYWLFVKQDLPVMPLVMIFLMIRPTMVGSVAAPTAPRLGWLAIAGLACLVLLLCWAGHRWALMGFDLSRDEQLADFDAWIYGHGAAVWPIAPPWRPYADALDQMYIQPVGDHEGWVSNYLPVNAATRAIFARLGMLGLAGPAFVTLGLVCLWRIARRLWPDDARAPIVAIAFYLCSSQILTMGMTAYAMNAHVALNLLWLLLFLRGGKAGHGGAMLVGLLATGIHQPLFHPLFVLPFLDLLRRERRWTTLGAYCLAYAAIGAVWAAWPLWISAHGHMPVPAGAAPVGIGYIDRVRTAFELEPRSAALMAMNLIRFAAWQNLLLLPLLALGVVVGWRRDPVARSLAIGMALPLLAVTMLTPYQGHGWGYRYLHGVIGSACILATGGSVWLRSRGGDMARPLQWASGLSLALFMVHLAMAHHQSAPYARLDRAMRASTADVLIVDTGNTPFSQDLVVNRPDLSARPVRLIGTLVDPAQIASLCRGRSLTFVDAPRLREIDALFGQETPQHPSTHQRELAIAARAARCVVRPFA